jgi:hypothetical protein
MKKITKDLGPRAQNVETDGLVRHMFDALDYIY